MKYMDYTPEQGKISYPEGFAELLEGLSIEEQLSYFRLGNGLYLNEKFTDRKKNPYHAAVRLEECTDVKAIIVHDNKIVGVWVFDEQIYRDVACLPEQGYCCRYDDEPDGSGYKEFALYQYLICVSDTFE